MQDVYERILSTNQNVSVMLISKNGNFIKSNLEYQKALEKSSCVLNFADKARIILNKLFPEEPIEFIRIKGRKSNEIFVTYDEQLEIVVLQNITGH